MGLGSTVRVRVRKDILQSEVRYLDVSLDILSPSVEYRVSDETALGFLFTSHQRGGMMVADTELWTYLGFDY